MIALRETISFTTIRKLVLKRFVNSITKSFVANSSNLEESKLLEKDSMYPSFFSVTNHTVRKVCEESRWGFRVTPLC